MVDATLSARTRKRPGESSSSGRSARAIAATAIQGVRRFGGFVPLSPLGLAVASMGGACLYLASQWQDYALQAVGSACLLVTVVAMVSVSIAAFSLRRREHPTSVNGFETGRDLPSGYARSALRFWPMGRQRWRMVLPKGVSVTAFREGPMLIERLRFSRRGVVRTLGRDVAVQDSLGLSTVVLRRHEEVDLWVLPHVGRLAEVPLLTSYAGGEDMPHPLGADEGDRVEVRRYAPGDPARFIHWKVFARTRKLVSRVPERAIERSDRTVAYLVAHASDEASSAAARLAVEVGSRGAGGLLGREWVFGADGSLDEATSSEDARRLIVQSASAEKCTLPLFLRQAERSGPAALVLFLPAEVGPWLDVIEPIVRARQGRVRAVIAVDGYARTPEARTLTSRLREALLRTPTRPNVNWTSLHQVVKRLRAAGCPVAVADRATGRPIPVEIMAKEAS